jgi:hypothetical protein
MQLIIIKNPGVCNWAALIASDGTPILKVCMN